MKRKKEVLDPISESFNKLNSELEELRSKLGRKQEFDSEINDLLAENKELRSQVSLFKQDLIKLNSLNDRLTKELSTQRKKEDKHLNILEENTLLSKDTKQLNSTIKDLSKRCDFLEKKLKMCSQDKDTFASVAEQAKKEIALLSSEVVKMNKINNMLSKDLEVKGRQLTFLSAKKGRITDRLDYEISASDGLKKQIRVLENELLKFDKLNQELSGFNTEKNMQLKHLNTDVDSLKGNVKEKLLQLQSLHTELKKRDQLVEKLNVNIDSLKRNIIEKEQQIIHLNNDMISYRERLNVDERKNKNFEDELDASKARLSVFDKENKHLIEEVDNLNLTVSELKELLKKKNKELLDKQLFFENSLESAKKKFNQEISSMSKDNVELEIDYKSRISELNDHVDHLNRVIKAKERKEQEIIKRLASDFTELSNLEDEDISLGK